MQHHLKDLLFMVCMRSGKRFGLSTVEKSDIWSRWKTGQSLHEIGRAFDKPHTSIRHLLLRRGGIPPAARRRSRQEQLEADVQRAWASDPLAISQMTGTKRVQISRRRLN
jgi:hypothetical protein